MKILVLTTKFTHPDGSPWLVSELAEEFCRANHDVTVVNLDWQRSSLNICSKELPKNLRLIVIKAINVSPGIFGWIIKWMASSFLVLPFIVRQLITCRRYDLLVSFSPCSALWCALPLAAYISKRKFLVYWDFFPVHNFALIDKLPFFINKLAKKLENFLITRFNCVGLMSLKNKSAFIDYFNIPEDRLQMVILPIWTSVLSVGAEDDGFIRDKLSFGFEKVIFVFGGQITYGRNISELCEAAIAAHRVNSQIALVICGDGKLAESISTYARTHPNCIKYLGYLSRDEYLKVVIASDVGVVATIPGVPTPSYPSKSLDYMACGVPVMASVESCTDFGEIVETNGFGFSCQGNVESMANCMIKMASLGNLADFGRRGREFLAARHSVAHARSIITGAGCV